MFHPDIFRQALYLRRECQLNLIDACTDAAQFYGVNAAALYLFCVAMGVR